MGKRITPVILIILAVSCLLVESANSWYYFTTRGGARMQWIFNGGNNPNPRPIEIIIDDDTPLSVQGLISNVIGEWNTPFSETLNLLGAFSTGQAMDAAASQGYLKNPEPGKIWIVHDTDGSVLASFGLGPSNVLGLGLAITSAGAPSQIYSGLVIINADFVAGYSNGNTLIDTASELSLYQGTLLHEMGHVLGLAHSIGGGNRYETVNTLQDRGNVPVMYPFWYSDKPDTLQVDDQAGVLSLYQE